MKRRVPIAGPATRAWRRPAARAQALLLAALALAGCALQPVVVSLDGTWLVDVAPVGGAPSFSAGGTAVLVIDGGAATLRELVGGGAKRCTDLTLERYGDAVVFDVRGLDLGEGEATWGFTLEGASADGIVLANASETVTLDRIAGLPPIAACVAAPVLQVDLLPAQPSSSTLDAVGTTVYYNTDSGNPIVGYSVSDRAVVSSTNLGSGFDQDVPYLMALRPDGPTTFAYTTCRCGRSERFAYSDFTNNNVLEDSVDTRELADGAHQSIQFGFYDGEADRVVLGGRRILDGALGSAYQLLVLDPTTLTLLERRPLLPGIANYSIVDATMHGGRPMVLIGGGNIVELDASGAPVETYVLDLDVEGYASGLASVGSALAVLVEGYQDGIARVLLADVD
jgi:hypothetical protein